MSHIPVVLDLIGVSGPSIASEVNSRIETGWHVMRVKVDARTDSKRLSELLSYAEWPKSLPQSASKEAIDEFLLANTTRGENPFPQLVPDPEEPEDYYVRQHPSIENMWLVIDSDRGTIFSSWESEAQALCDAWELQDDNKACFAYFAMMIPTPKEYSISFETSSEWGWESPDGVCQDSFTTQEEALVAAWLHKNSVSITDTKNLSGAADSYGALHDGLSEMIEEGRLTEDDIPDDYLWLTNSLSQLASRPDSTAVLDRIHTILDEGGWDSSTLDKVTACLTEAGYSFSSASKNN